MPFHDIKGQDKQLGLLRNYMAEGRISGGYLFSGPEGIGKKLAAKTLAKALNCPEKENDACDKCPSCSKIENNQHPDIHIVGTESDEIKIDDIRQLQREINFRPYEAKFKVFIIDNAHTLNPEASNALLKILEEPPKNSLIILISDKPALLFKTITSRCKSVQFSPLKREGLKKLLQQDYHLGEKEAHFLAYFSEGRIGSALRLKDTDMLTEKNSVIDKFSSRHGLDSANLLKLSRQQVRDELNIMASWFRDIYLYKSGMPLEETINSDRKADLSKRAPEFTFPELDEIMNSLSASLLYLEQNINLKLLLYNLGARIWKA